MFKGNRIVRVVRIAASRNNMGGSVPIVTGFWNKWADVRERFGNPDTAFNQQQWSYEQEIRMRYEPTRPTHSNDLIYYNGAYYKILSISLDSEATVNFERCRCVKSDQLISTLPPMNVNNSQVWNYTADGTEGYSVTATELIGKTPFGAFKDGPGFEIIPNEITSGSTPDGNTKQVHINATNGVTTWSQPMIEGDKLQIFYYGT